jgi:hypothetical protein
MALKMRGQKTLDDRVDELMSEENLLIETQVEGKWTPVKG